MAEFIENKMLFNNLNMCFKFRSAKFLNKPRMYVLTNVYNISIFTLFSNVSNFLQINSDRSFKIK